MEVEKIGVAPPSSRSVQVIVPVSPTSPMPIVTLPLTVAPSAGLVIVALGGASASWMVTVADPGVPTE